MPNLKILLNFIGKYEGRGSYNIVWGGIKKQHLPPYIITTMTVGDLLNWQDSVDRLYMSEAAGLYQIMEDTLRDLVSQGHASKSDLFNEKTQDKLATALLKRRGLDSYLAGKITAEKFANFIAREWASMPLVDGPNKGKSYYAGDGLNKSHTSVTDFLATVRLVRGDGPAVRPDAPNADPATPGAPAGIVAAILAALAAFFVLKKG